MDSCEAAATAAGVNLTTYADSVSHSIHSITVEDIQFFFEPDFPIENTIPTVNVDFLEGEDPVIGSAPAGHSAFRFPGLATFDFILSNNDKPESFLVNGMSTLEKLSHQLHMHEMWMKAAVMYKQIKTRQFDTDSICPCLIDEQNNGIIDSLKAIAHDLKQWMPQAIINGTRTINRMERELKLVSYIYVDDKDVLEVRQSRALDPEAVWTVPELKDSTSWIFWKELLMKSMLSDEKLFGFAMYMFCKANV